MKSKTPKFDELIEEVLKNLVPHTRVCKWYGKHKHCEGEFEVLEGDIEFLKMFRVPPPNFCPTCRRIRRGTHMNMLYIFKRDCGMPGHNEKFISLFPPECPFPVYEYDHFISDDFDPFNYGIEYKSTISPLEALFNLRKTFPMPSFLNRDPSSINSPYSNGGKDSKNAYYVMGCYSSEDVWYSNLVNKSREVMDGRNIQTSTRVYHSAYADNIYNSSFIYFSKDCLDSMFLFDCRNCVLCFNCVNLRNAKYCINNKQVSKEEYEAFMNSIYPLSRQSLNQYIENFWAFVKSMPLHASRNVNTENVLGVALLNSRNLYDVTDSKEAEHMRHSDGCLSHKDSMDVLVSGGNSQMLYTTSNVGSQSSNVKFSVSSLVCSDSEFIFNSKNLNNCFMCFGLRDKSYCILNQPYSKDEYYKLVDEIKCKMMEVGEYGDGPDMKFSAQAYNTSLGQIAFPLSEFEIISIGGYVAKEPEIDLSDLPVISKENIPELIKDVKDDILQSVFICKISGRPFRITASELAFYRNMNLPLPDIHPVVRMKSHFDFCAQGVKYSSLCSNCKSEIQSTFNPQDGYTLYCDKCYQQQVYQISF